jgi:hypothetical protein
MSCSLLGSVVVFVEFWPASSCTSSHHPPGNIEKQLLSDPPPFTCWSDVCCVCVCVFVWASQKLLCLKTDTCVPLVLLTKQTYNRVVLVFVPGSPCPGFTLSWVRARELGERERER